MEIREASEDVQVVGVADERDRLAILRPGRLRACADRLGEPSDARPVGVHDVDLAEQMVARAREHDSLSI